MGYFPLPELKGKPNRIFVDGKTLNQIAKESGIRLDTVQHRYSAAALPGAFRTATAARWRLRRPDRPRCRLCRACR